MKTLAAIIVVLFSLVSNAFATTRDKKEKESPKESIRFKEAILPERYKEIKLYPQKKDKRYF